MRWLSQNCKTDELRYTLPSGYTLIAGRKRGCGVVQASGSIGQHPYHPLSTPERSFQTMNTFPSEVLSAYGNQKGTNHLSGHLPNIALQSIHSNSKEQLPKSEAAVHQACCGLCFATALTSSGNRCTLRDLRKSLRKISAKTMFRVRPFQK